MLIALLSQSSKTATVIPKINWTLFIRLVSAH